MRTVPEAQLPTDIGAFEAVDAAYPRDEAFRTSAEYAAYTRAASDALHDAMGEAA